MSFANTPVWVMRLRIWREPGETVRLTVGFTLPIGNDLGGESQVVIPELTQLPTHTWATGVPATSSQAQPCRDWMG